MEKFTINNYDLPLINFKSVIENYEWLIKKRHRECAFINLQINNKLALGSESTFPYLKNYQKFGKFVISTKIYVHQTIFFVNWQNLMCAK